MKVIIIKNNHSYVNGNLPFLPKSIKHFILWDNEIRNKCYPINENSSSILFKTLVLRILEKNNEHT